MLIFIARTRIFPYGASRHTVVLGVLGAIGIATLLEHVPRRMGVALLSGMQIGGLLWQLEPSRSSSRNGPELS
jgi:hypothetical protein